MKKNILLTSLLFAGLFLTTNIAQAAPPPHSAHGAPMGHIHKPPHGHINHRPPVHHIHRPPIHNHNMLRVRHYYGFPGAYYYGYYPITYSIPRLYHPLHHGHLGATFHISL